MQRSEPAPSSSCASRQRVPGSGLPLSPWCYPLGAIPQQGLQEHCPQAGVQLWDARVHKVSPRAELTVEGHGTSGAPAGAAAALEPGLPAEEEDEVQRVPASTGATEPTSWEPGPCLASRLPPWAAVSLLWAQGCCKPSAFCNTATQEVWGMPCSSPRFWLAAALPLCPGAAVRAVHAGPGSQWFADHVTD